MAAVPKAIETIGVLATFGHEAGIDHQGLLMLRRDDGRDGALVERDPIDVGVSHLAKVRSCYGL